MIINPENYISLLKKYHTSSKLLIPLYGASYLAYHYEKPYANVIGSFNMLNIGFHSYVSTSSIIGDYIKPQNIKKIVKVINFKSHLVACVGFLYLINYKNKNLKL